MSPDLSKLSCVKPTANGWTARCPVCFGRDGSDKTGNHLSILRTGQFNCIVGSQSDPRHNRLIRDTIRGEIDDFEYVDPAPKLSPDKVYPESTLTNLLKDYDYWLKRGIKEEVLAKLEGGLAPHNERGKLEGRFILPVRDLQNRIVGFAGRLTGENSFAPKWKNLVRTSKVAYPWNVTGNDIKRSRTAILVESPGDLLSCLSADIKPVLCIFGLNLNGLIISTLIGANVQRIIISLNRDEDPQKGQAAAERLERKLSPFFSHVEIRLPNDFKDWNEALMGGERGLAELAAFRAEVENG